MSFERTNKGLTKRTRELLAGGESASVDFKRNASGLSTEDLVAFANSDSGGDILIGVAEAKRADGSQFGEIVGHELDDNTVLLILNKAISCVPPVAVNLYAENKDKMPIIRIFVPSGSNKPHSTPKGVYCRRDGSRNRPLHPGELLEIFLDAEGRVFADRFEQAAGSMVDNMTELEIALAEKIESIGTQLGWAEYKVGDTADTIDIVRAHVHNLQEETEDITTRLRVLFQQDDRDDPIKARAKADILEKMNAQLADNPDLAKALLKGGEVEIKASGRLARDLDRSDLKELVTDAIEALTKKSEDPVVDPD